MSNEIRFQEQFGLNLYALIRQAAGQVWDVTNTQWTAWADGNIGDYDIVLTDRSGGYYEADFPAGIDTAGIYAVQIRQRVGGGPSVNDNILASGLFAWNGAAWTQLQKLGDDLSALRGNLGTNTVTITVQDQADSSAIADVKVEIRTSPTGPPIWIAFTDANGQCSLQLNDGTYYVTLSKLHVYSFASLPKTLAVSGNTNQTYQGTAFTPTINQPVDYALSGGLVASASVTALEAKWWVDSDNAIKIIGLRNSLSGAYINDATITAQLADDEGADVGSPVTFYYQSGTDGHYHGVVPSDLGLTDGRQYTLTITVEGADYQRVIKITKQAAYKGPDW